MYSLEPTPDPQTENLKYILLSKCLDRQENANISTPLVVRS